MAMDGEDSGTYSLGLGCRLEISLFSFLGELVPCLLVGVWIGRRHPQFSGRVAQPLVRFGVPISVMGLLLRGGITSDMVVAAVIAAVAISLTLLISAGVPCLRRWLGGPCGWMGSCVGNTAYFGVPAALALLPPEALPISIGYDLGATLLVWSLGPLVIGGIDWQRESGLLQRLWRGLSSSPVLPGLIGALMVQLTPWREGVALILWWPSRLVILLALAVVGMRLGTLVAGRGTTSANLPPLGTLLPALVGKLLLYPLLLLLIGLWLGLDSVVVQAITLQGAAPTAISILLIAESVRCHQAFAAGLVLWSTMFALLVSPAWGYLLQKIFITAA